MLDTVTFSFPAVISIAFFLWVFSTLKPGHTALYGLIIAKTCQKLVSFEADDVVRVDVEFKMI